MKLYVGPLQVTGFITVPIDQTVSGWHRTTRTRFLSVTQARVQPIQDGMKFADNEGAYTFVLINRRRLTALVEMRVAASLNDTARPAQPVETSPPS